MLLDNLPGKRLENSSIAQWLITVTITVKQLAYRQAGETIEP